MTDSSLTMLTFADTPVSIQNAHPGNVSGDVLTADTPPEKQNLNNFPCWFRGRERAIAQALEAEGYNYIGLADDFCVEFDYSDNRKWHIGGAYQEMAIDVVYDGALFTCPFPDEWSREQLEAELKRLKRLIKKTATDWDSQIDNGQLALDLDGTMSCP